MVTNSQPPTAQGRGNELIHGSGYPHEPKDDAPTIELVKDRPVTALSAAELAAWHCDTEDRLPFQCAVEDWLTSIGCPRTDEQRRGIVSVRLERHRGKTTVVVTRRTPAGVKPVRERWPMTVEPPARPAFEVVDGTPRVTESPSPYLVHGSPASNQEDRS